MSVIKIANGLLPLYLSSGSGKHAVVVIQEWWGLNDQIKAITERIASAGGFKAVAPDLYHGKKTADPDEAHHLMSNLDWPGAIKDIQSTVDYLKNDCGCEKVAVLGFCMGGALSIASAVKVNGINASVCFYGIPDRNFAKAEDIKCPLLCHFGKKDTYTGFSDVKSVSVLKEHLSKQSNHPFQVLSYDDADHAFMNESRPEVYNPEASKLAMQRSIDFIKNTFST